MHINEIAPPDLMHQMIVDGYVRVQNHPTIGLRIFNYSDSCTWDRQWNEATRAARGLIIDDSGAVVARPFRKFHNLGEPGAHEPTADERVIVTDKADGSLGILYPLPDGTHAIATRGSFTSEQAVHGTQVWRERYADRIAPDRAQFFDGFTFLFEVVYPANRIVLDYDGMDDLILLGAVRISDGASVPPQTAAKMINWPGPVVEVFEFDSLADAIAAPPRPNAEGLVVWSPDTDERVKIKQADYIALHRILTGVTSRTLWELAAVQTCWPIVDQGDEVETVKYLERKLHLGKARIHEIRALGDDWMNRYISGVPEEFETWVRNTVAQKTENAASTTRAWVELYDAIVAEFGGVPADRAERRAFVQLARERAPRDVFHHVLSQIDGREIVTAGWWWVYPDLERPFIARSEDAA